jgi:flagellar assembly factor FliW
MKANTRFFGEIDIEEDKLIHFENGIIGFPELKTFTLIYDEEKKGKASISWLQSMEEPELALPVMDPLDVEADYNPMVEEEFIKPLGEFTSEDLLALVTVTVPKDIKKIAVNLKAPIIINTKTRNAGQLIVENDYPVKYQIYDLIKKEEKAGE